MGTDEDWGVRGGGERWQVEIDWSFTIPTKPDQRTSIKKIDCDSYELMSFEETLIYLHSLITCKQIVLWKSSHIMMWELLRFGLDNGLKNHQLWRNKMTLTSFNLVLT